MFMFYSSPFKAFIKGISKEWSSFVSPPLVCSSRGAWVFPRLWDSRRHIFLTHDSFIYLLWKVGRPAHWRLFRRTRLGWRIQKDWTGAWKFSISENAVNFSAVWFNGSVEGWFCQCRCWVICEVCCRIKLNHPIMSPSPLRGTSRYEFSNVYWDQT